MARRGGTLAVSPLSDKGGHRSQEETCPRRSRASAPHSAYTPAHTAAGRRGDRRTSGMSAPAGYRFGDEEGLSGHADAARSPVADVVFAQSGSSSSSFAGSARREVSARLGSPRGAREDCLPSV